MRKSLYQRENKIFLRLLQELRKGAGISQAQASERLGRPQSFISKIERGERRIDILELRTLCQVYGCGLTHFSDVLEAQLAKRDSGAGSGTVKTD